ncbi:TPA: glycosyltransferase family 2 protein [Legionella pneumophila]|uniref:Lipopolysaccharide biosynthesis glycosyltransferase n=3 Tax=Legionella pneumophila TaxID=446 RepID=Q5ZXB1_LEGPH|nr:glycosyltransferase family 2 protein [Legionella pneumophila]ERH45269.1 glycosyl transferase [Legionella pneumophila str. Leg01/11]ERI48481.1 glycosyl transferase [Legionella pneumophila str. Leg01/20]WBV62471.1 glycosyltransferase family 2 protein [Legionella pneumophila 130b]AAU26909.1 lipopolysaccharide biosynthesis glycosyltransferase [Legionella pneumophila subsp. pneumophila str. Philadelphia 1]AMQ27274.1 glycosyl transferase [Legionella pneumophila subsp. pneumophila]
MLSVIIITKNEEANIRRCLESVHFADEIIVLDSGSTDNTLAIAREYTDKVFSTDWQGYGIQKDRALQKAQGDWVLNLDADESVSSELRQEILQAISSDTADAFRIPIQMIFYNQVLKYSGSPKRHIRLFKRENASYSKDIVHEKVLIPVNARVGKLKKPIWHHSFSDVHHVLYKLNKYSSYSAKIRIESNEKVGLVKTFFSALWMFVRCLFLQKGFLDGRAGFLFAVFGAQGAFYRGVKQIYKDRDINKLPSVNHIKEE